MKAKKAESPPGKRRAGPIRAALVRGLAVVLPPLLTILIFLWALGLIRQHVYDRVYGLARYTWVQAIEDIKYEKDFPQEDRDNPNPTLGGIEYQKLPNGDKATYVPAYVYDTVCDDTRVETLPTTGREWFERYVELKHLQPHLAIPCFICAFILVLYLLGKFMAAGAGRFFWGTFERGIHRVPFVRKVYGSVKQVIDLLLTDSDVEYLRVVAVEWPRKGIWCLALVTGSSLKEVWAAAGEEVLSALIPTSPFPMTGFTVSVKKSETVDLNISIDEAIQFIVSCGVVVPPEHLKKMQAPADTSPELVAAGDSAKSKSGDS